MLRTTQQALRTSTAVNLDRRHYIHVKCVHAYLSEDEVSMSVVGLCDE